MFPTDTIQILIRAKQNKTYGNAYVSFSRIAGNDLRRFLYGSRLLCEVNDTNKTFTCAEHNSNEYYFNEDIKSLRYLFTKKEYKEI